LSEVNIDQSMFRIDNRDQGPIDNARSAAEWFLA
jgi:hypothetical protein